MQNQSGFLCSFIWANLAMNATTTLWIQVHQISTRCKQSSWWWKGFSWQGLRLPMSGLQPVLWLLIATICKSDVMLLQAECNVCCWNPNQILCTSCHHSSPSPSTLPNKSKALIYWLLLIFYTWTASTKYAKKLFDSWQHFDGIPHQFLISFTDLFLREISDVEARFNIS